MTSTEYVQDPLQGLSQQELLQTSDGELSVLVSKEVSEADEEHLWEMIETGFAALNSRSYDKQSMAYDEFLEDMRSPNVLKYVAYNNESIPIGCMTVHVGIEDVPWVDKDIFIKTQARVDPEATSYYIGTLVVTPDMRGTETAPRLVQAALLHFRNINETTQQNSMCFFDCAEANHPWLAKYVESISKPSDDFEGVPIEVNELGVEYWAEDLKDQDLANTPHVIKKVVSISEEPGRYNVLDTQHFYSIELKDTQES